MSPNNLIRHDLDRLVIGDRILSCEPVPTGFDGGTGWMHSGIAVLADGSLVVAHPEGGRLVRIHPDGTNTLVPTDLTEMHCIVPARQAEGDVLWIADNGHRYVHDTPAYGEIRVPGRLVALRFDGTIAQELTDPGVDGPWSPTSVAVVDPSDPASDIWVADGYGQSLVHRFSADGTLRQTIDGSRTGIRFDCPHGLLVRGSGPDSELYVADRANRRIVVLDLAGEVRRIIGAEVLDSPSSLVDLGGHLLVTELFGAIAVFDGDAYVGHLGSSGRDHDDPVWPNTKDPSGCTVAPELFEGTFNSPHGITVAGGVAYVTEWMIGGRVLRLIPSAR